MKNLLILGTGCAACNTLAERTGQAAAEMALEHTLDKVGDMEKILAFDVASTPALVVDGKVMVSGRVPSLAEIKSMLS